METELKLRMAPAALERVARFPLLTGAHAESVQTLDAIYFDTPDCDLQRKGASLRVRRESGRWIQTVKWAGGVRGGLHERNELEVEVPGPSPDCAKIVHPDLDPLFRSAHLQANEQGVLEGEDPEFLHQMRVALRRLRSAFSAFSGALPDAARTPVAEELRWLNRALAPARDWDVFVTETLPPLRRAFENRPALETLASEAVRLRGIAQRDMRRAVRSRRYQKVLITLASWLTTRAWREHADARARRARRARSRLCPGRARSAV